MQSTLRKEPKLLFPFNPIKSFCCILATGYLSQRNTWTLLSHFVKYSHGVIPGQQARGTSSRRNDLTWINKKIILCPSWQYGVHENQMKWTDLPELVWCRVAITNPVLIPSLNPPLVLLSTVSWAALDHGLCPYIPWNKVNWRLTCLCSWLTSCLFPPTEYLHNACIPLVLPQHSNAPESS